MKATHLCYHHVGVLAAHQQDVRLSSKHQAGRSREAETNLKLSCNTHVILVLPLACTAAQDASDKLTWRLIWSTPR